VIALPPDRLGEALAYPNQLLLSAAAQEIQALLNTLAETDNTSTNGGQEKLIKEASANVSGNPMSEPTIGRECH
jgi:uncharacterized membrane protein